MTCSEFASGLCKNKEVKMALFEYVVYIIDLHDMLDVYIHLSLETWKVTWNDNTHVHRITGLLSSYFILVSTSLNKNTLYTLRRILVLIHAKNLGT